MKDLLYAFQLNRWDLLTISFEWMVLEFAGMALFTSLEKKEIACKGHKGIYSSQRSVLFCEYVTWSPFHYFWGHTKEKQKGIFALNIGVSSYILITSLFYFS